jgi:MtrB/PioB family decaheme-associated outer membrane protein
MRQLVALLTGLAAVAPAALAQDTSRVQTSGRITTGFQQHDNSTGSSKFSEYRDRHDQLLDFRLGVWNPRGMFLDAAGANLTREDQSLRVAAGDLGRWRLDLGWDEIPHLFSNKAQSPYTASGPGLFTVSQPMVITFKKLATAAADAPSVLAQDAIISAYAQSFVRPTSLGTQTHAGTAAFRYNAIEGLELSAGYSRRTKTGSQLGYGPIGDRPPRTLNIELAEPVDYRTGDLRLAAGWDGGRYQARVEYLYSNFANDIDDLTWQNVYATPTAGATFDAWDRRIGAFGRRPLPPDNRYHNLTLSGGLNLPLDSRLAVGFAYGRMEQDQALLPYAYQSDVLAVSTLPRTNADARINTTYWNVEYSIVPVSRLNLRAFVRRYDLDNETPMSQWQYATQDAINTNGTTSFKNKRVSLAYAWDRLNAGADATFRLSVWNSSLGLGFEREDVGREFREADTDENIFRASWRARPTGWLRLGAKYLHGDRDGGTYNYQVNQQSYWYAPADAGTDNDNPQFTFTNHPDMRRYDVSDRKRDRVDLSAGLTPDDRFAISATFRYQRDDFDSEVQSVQPLLGLALADADAATPGDQLGLLRNERQQLGFDLFYAAAERLDLNGSIGWDRGESRSRSIEFNENNKQNPSSIAAADLGPWTRATSQWTADFEDRTWYAGAGGSYVIGRTTISANYTLSLARIDLEYAGFGLTNFNGTPFPSTNQFAFESPPTVRHDSHVADLRVDFPLPIPRLRDIMMAAGYTFDSYRIRDWMQDFETPWYEQVGTEFLLRDTSRSHQWGNRLFNAGRFLAPGYTAHLGFVSFTYSF